MCDRGADTFEFIEHEVNSGRRFVIRSSHNRRIFIGHDTTEHSAESNLHTYLKSLPAQGTWQLEVTSKNELRRGRGHEKKKRVQRITRTANMAVAYAPFQIRQSKCKGAKDCKPLQVWAIRVWEVDPPEGQERLEWILLTNEPVIDFSTAYRVVGWYDVVGLLKSFTRV